MSPVSPNEDVGSPCNSICSMDVATGLCAGYLRTLDEIASWGQLVDDEKRALLRTLAVRRARDGAAILERWQEIAHAQR